MPPTTRRKVAQKATTFLRSLRPKQSILRNGKAYHNSEARWPPLDSESSSSSEDEGSTTLPRLPKPYYALREGTGILGKRRRKRGQKMARDTIAIHEDETARPLENQQRRKMSTVEEDYDRRRAEEFEHESDGTESDEELDESVIDDMRKLEESFAGISSRYRLVNRIGEGTFSTVYKAEQLDPNDQEDTENIPTEGSEPAPKRRKLTTSSQTTAVERPRKSYVALKKIYVTSSPHRILNELELLHDLRDCEHICPLLTAFRHQDQVVAVLPYFRHLDFRLYYHKFIANDIRHYMFSLLKGLEHVHKHGIIHRDIKPTNFLYDVQAKRGQLVDFGLAERQGTDWQNCLCREEKGKWRQRFLNSFAYREYENRGSDRTAPGYPTHDSRPSRRANRAGTRGFRAPEVLFKCTAQTTKLDIWSAGVILLTILARRFPFFNSSDDIDATIEISHIFGSKRMQNAAALHGQFFETNISTIGNDGYDLEKIVRWASCREKRDFALHDGELQAIDFLRGLLELDPQKRLSASAALSHDFFQKPDENEYEEALRKSLENGQSLSDAENELAEDEGDDDEDEE